MSNARLPGTIDSRPDLGFFTILPAKPDTTMGFTAEALPPGMPNFPRVTAMQGEADLPDEASGGKD